MRCARRLSTWPDRRPSTLAASRSASIGPFTPRGTVSLRTLFAANVSGYAGWFWSVAVTRAPRSRSVTVDEVVLLPGPDALLAPPWVPWSERLRPGDLNPGDLLPADPDDPRVVSRVLLDGRFGRCGTGCRGCLRTRSRARTGAVPRRSSRGGRAVAGRRRRPTQRDGAQRPGPLRYLCVLRSGRGLAACRVRRVHQRAVTR